MKSLAADFFKLSANEKRKVHFKLCTHALRRWNEYTAKAESICYTDSVVGMNHELDLTLPGDAFSSAQAGSDTLDIEERYLEPIVAMQDNDLEFPMKIEFAYYAVYNLFRRYVLHDEIDDWLIVNQAVSCEKDESGMNTR